MQFTTLFQTVQQVQTGLSSFCNTWFMGNRSLKRNTNIVCHELLVKFRPIENIFTIYVPVSYSFVLLHAILKMCLFVL